MTDATGPFDAESPIVGVVHLPPLPGAPGYEGSRGPIRERALRDARALVDGGVDGLIVENYGDGPFHGDDVPAHVVAEMTAAVDAVTDAVEVPVGVNVLRNDATAALSVAAAAGGDFVRVNVHVGAAATDQGIVEGRAAETLRYRERIDADVAIWADVDVKHATALDDRPIGDRAREAVDRGRADAVIVSGPGTGRRTDRSDLEVVADAVEDAPVIVGSGVTVDTAAETLETADGAIVGTAFKVEGVTENPVDGDRVERLIAAARGERE